MFRNNKIAALRVLDLAFTQNVKNGAYYEDGVLIPVTSKLDPHLCESLYTRILKEIENPGFHESVTSGESEIEMID